MKLIDYFYQNDGGPEYYFELGVFKWFTFISIILWLNHPYSDSCYVPDIRITFGTHCLFELSVDFLNHNVFLEILDFRKTRTTIDYYRGY